MRGYREESGSDLLFLCTRRFASRDGQHVEIAVCAEAAEDRRAVQVRTDQSVSESVMEDSDDLLDLTTIGLGEAVGQICWGRGTPRFRNPARDRTRGTARGRTRSTLEATR